MKIIMISLVHAWGLEVTVLKAYSILSRVMVLHISKRQCNYISNASTQTAHQENKVVFSDSLPGNQTMSDYTLWAK